MRLQSPDALCLGGIDKEMGQHGQKVQLDECNSIWRIPLTMRTLPHFGTVGAKGG